MKKLILSACICSLALIPGCAEDPQPTDEDYIESLVAGSPLTLFGNIDGQDGGASRDVEVPEFWWRSLTGLGQLWVTFEGDPAVGVCTLTVERPFLAVLNIDVVHDGQLLAGTKTIADGRVRRVVVERTGESSDPYGGWVVASITPAEFYCGPAETQEVFVTAMRLYRDGDLLLSLDDPDTFLDVAADLPDLAEGDFLRLEVEAIHQNPTHVPEFFVYAHGPLPTWPRHIMYDDGQFGDLEAGDGIYTYEWYAEATNEHRVIAADVIDADTMADQTEQDYDSGAWTVPYLGME